MAHGHEDRDLLLQALNPALLARPMPLLELLHRIPRTRALLHTEIDACKVAFAKLLLNTVVLLEAIRSSRSWVSEDEAGLVENGNLIAVAQLSSLVTSNDSIVDECPIRGEIFEDADAVAAAGFTEDEAVSI